MADRTQGRTEALLDAASELLAAEGPQALTMRRIASVAGGSTMNLYSRFGGKEGVIEALFREGFRRLNDEVMSAPATEDPIADLLACATGYRRFALANPGYYAVMFDRVVPGFEPSEPAMTEARKTLHALAQRVRRAIDAGQLAEADEFELAGGLWATNHGLVSLELRDARGLLGVWEQRHSATISALLRGLSPERAGPDARSRH